MGAFKNKPPQSSTERFQLIQHIRAKDAAVNSTNETVIQRCYDWLWADVSHMTDGNMMIE